MNKIMIEVEAAEEADDIINSLAKIFKVKDVNVIGNNVLLAKIDQKELR